MSLKFKLIKALIQKNCIEIKEDTNGYKSCLNFNKLFCYNHIINIIIDEIYNKIKYIDVSYIASNNLNSIVLSSLVTNKYNYTNIIVRDTKLNLNYLEIDNKRGIFFIDEIANVSSVIKSCLLLKKNSIIVNDIVTIKKLSNNDHLSNYNIHYLFDDYDIFKVMRETNQMSNIKLDKLMNKFNLIDNKSVINKYEYLSLYSKIPILKKLSKIMIDKKTNLCIDFRNTNFKQMIEIIAKISNHICMIEVDYNIVSVNPIYQNSLSKMSKMLNFVIIIDKNLNIDNSITIVNYLENDINKLDYPCVLRYNNLTNSMVTRENIEKLISIDLNSIKNINIIGYKTDNVLNNNYNGLNISESYNLYNSNQSSIKKLIIDRDYDIINYKLHLPIGDNVLINTKIIAWTSYMEKNNT